MRKRNKISAIILSGLLMAGLVTPSIVTGQETTLTGSEISNEVVDEKEIDLTDDDVTLMPEKEKEPLLQTNELESETLTGIDKKGNVKGSNTRDTKNTPTAQAPVTKDNITIEKITMRWLSKSTGETEKAGFNDLVLVPPDDVFPNQQWQLDVAFSGKGFIEAGDIEIVIPAYIWKTRDGKEPGRLTLAIPEEPDMSNDFAWKRVGDTIVITNTRKLSAASKYMIQGTFRNTYPDPNSDKPFTTTYAHEMNDIDTVGEVQYKGVSDDLFGIVTVVTPENRETISMTSNSIKATLDTHVEITSAAKKAQGDNGKGKVYLETPTDIPELLPENPDDYYYVQWYVSGTANGNQPYTLKLSDTAEDNYSAKMLGIKDEETVFKSSDGKTVEFDLYEGATFESNKGTYLWTAYPKSEFTQEGETYTLNNSVTMTVTGEDDEVVTTKDASDSVSFRLPITWHIKKVWQYNEDKYPNSTLEEIKSRQPEETPVWLTKDDIRYTNSYYNSSVNFHNDKLNDENNWYTSWTDDGVPRGYKPWEYNYNVTRHLHDEGGVSYPIVSGYLGDRVYFPDGTWFQRTWSYDHKATEYDDATHTWTFINDYHEGVEWGGFNNKYSKSAVNHTDSRVKSTSDTDLKLIRDNKDTTKLRYRVWTEQNVLPYTSDTLNYTNENDLYKKDVTLEILDHREWLGERELTSDDYYMSGVVLDTPNVWRWVPDTNLYTYGTFTKEASPDTTLYGYNGTDWVEYATLSNDTVTTYNGATATGKTITFPEDTVYQVKTNTTTNMARIEGSYYVDIVLKPSAKNKEDVERLFLVDDYIMEKEVNQVNFKLWQNDECLRDWSDRATEYLHGRNYRLAVDLDKKSVFTENDRNSRQLKWNHTVTLNRNSTVVSRSEFETALEEGYIKNSESGTFYDLLPPGMQADTSSFTINGGTIKTVNVIDNYKDSGSQLVIVKADINKDIVYNYKKPDKEYDDTYPDGYGLKKVTINFDSLYSYDEARARGLTGLRNTAAYMADEEIFGDAKYWSGETDAPTGDAHKESLGAVREDLRGLMSDLDTARNLPNTVYAGADMRITEVDSSALTNIKKHVTATGYDKWAYGYETPINVFEGGKYTYRITLTADSDTTTSDIIILDDLEYYKPVKITDPGDSGVETGKVMSRREFEATNELLVNSGATPMTGEEANGWSGHFRGINISEIQSMDVDAKVYYCTNDTRVDSLNPAHTENTVGDYLEANWTTTPPENLDSVTAIAIDCRKKTDGSAFELHEGESLIAYVNMVAPTYEECPEIFADTDYDDYRNNWKAYNNVYMDINQVDDVGNKTHSYDHFDYTEIGIYGGRLEIEKEWNDTDDNDRIRPASVTGKVLGNGEDIGKTFLIDETHPKTVIEHIPLYTPDGDEIYYEALENPVEGYESESRIVRDGNNFKLVITNKHELIKTELPVEKFWASDTEGDEWKNYIPNAVTVELYAKYPGSETATSTGKRMTLLKARDWKDTFTDLQKFKDGEEIEYSVKEVAFSDDWASVSEGGTVTNTYHPYGNLKVTKHCEDTTEVNADKEFIFTLSLTETDGSGHVGRYDYEIKKNNEIISTGKIGDGNEFKLKDGEEIFIKDIPSKISYKISETDAPGFNVSDKTGDMGKITSNKTSESEFTNTYYSRGSYSLKATKNLTGTALTRGRFRFEVYDAEGKRLRTASNQENGDVLFGNFNFTNADHNKTFTYKIKEVNTNKPGYTYDDTEYTVNLTPVDNGDGTMTVTCDTDMEDIVFNNEYHADGEVTLKAWKQLQGRDLTAGEFEFVLRDEDGNVVQTKTNDADGKIVFDALQFNETHVGNTYIYTVEEKKGDDETVNYDDTVHGYSIYVVDNGDGTLSFTQSAVDMENYWIESELEDNVGGAYIYKPTPQGEYKNEVVIPDYLYDLMNLEGFETKEITFNERLLYEENYRMAEGLRIIKESNPDEYIVLFHATPTISYGEYDESQSGLLNNSVPTYATEGYYGTGDNKQKIENPNMTIYISHNPGDNYNEIGFSLPYGCKYKYKNPDWQPTEVNTAPVFTNSLKDGELSLTKRTINSTDPNKKFKFRIKINSDKLDNVDYNITEASPAGDNNGKGAPDDNNGPDDNGTPDDHSGSAFSTPALNYEIPQREEKSLLDRLGDAFNSVKELFTGETVEAAIVDWTEYTQNGSNIKWMIDDDGALHVEPINEGDVGVLKYNSSDTGTNRPPWYNQRTSIKSVAQSTGQIQLVGSMSNMFYDCSSLTDISGLSDWNTEKVTTLNSTFYGCRKLTNVDGLSDWNTGNVTSLYYTFAGCNNLTNVDGLSDWNTEKVTALNGTFSGCSKLTNVDGLSDWNTEKVTTLNSTFYNCNNLTNVDGLSDWNTGDVTTLASTFYGCSSLENVDGLSDWNTEKVTTLEKTFYGCSSLENVDGLSDWDTGNVTTLGFTFSGCNKLTNVDGLSNWNTEKVTRLGNTFYGCNSLENVDGLSDWNTEKVTTLSNTFYNCNSLTNVDGLSDWNTEKVTTLEKTFYGCSSLENVDGLSDWNTGNVTTLGNTFYGCNSLTNVDGLSDWNTEKVTRLGATFYGCSSLENVDGLSNWDTGNVTTLASTFSGCSKLTNVDGLSNWNTEKVTTLGGTFYECNSLENVDGLSDWNTEKVTNLNSTFYKCSKLTKVDGLSNWNTEKVTTLGGTFYGCSSLENVDGLSNWDTSKITSMYNTFYDCNSLINVDGLSNWDTGNVTYMTSMFNGCSKLTNVDVLNNWNVKNVKYMSMMFKKCTQLSSANIGDWDTSNVIAISEFFSNCDNLLSINLNNWDTSKIKNDTYHNSERFHGFYNFIDSHSSIYGNGKLSSITLGEKFDIDGDNMSNGYIFQFPTPPSSTTTGKWVIEDRSLPSMTPNELRDNYDGSTMAGTWVWETKAFKLMFESDDASGSMATVWAPNYEPYTIPTNTFTKPGYDFDHWEDGNGNTYTDTIPKDKYALNEEVTLRPVFTKRAMNEIEPGIYEIELMGDETVTLTGIPGGTSYEIYEETENGWVLVSTTNDSGVIQPLQTTEAEFTNRYEPGTTTVQFRGEKTLDGKLSSGFTFGLYEGENLIAETTTNDSGAINFPVIKYTEAGTHTYTVRELNQTDSTINYDTHEETITVVVTDDGEGNLSTDYDSDFSFTFENTTKPGSILLTKQRVNRDTDNFTFNVRLTKDNAPYTGDVLVGETTVTPDENGMFSVEVTDSVEISNIPAGVEYEITEEEKHGWTNTEAIGDTGTIIANWQSGATFTNEYHASGMARLVAHKSLVGDTLSEGDYTFTLTDRYSDNILKNTDNINWMDSGLDSTNGGWSVSGNGTGEFFCTEIGDGPVASVPVSMGIVNHDRGIKQVKQDISVESGEEYTLTGYVRIPPGTEEISTTDAYLTITDGTTNYLDTSFLVNSHEWKPFKYTFTPETDSVSVLAGVRTQGGRIGEVIEYSALSIVKGSDVIQTKTNTAPDMNETDADENPNPYYGTGAVIFDDIYYDESDIGKTYTYFIHEVTGDDDTVIYDNHVATATVTVTDSGEGYLNTEVTYNGEVFTNEKKTGSLQLDKFTQKQGDAPEEIVETKTLATAYTDTEHESYSNTRTLQGTDSSVTNNSGGELSTGELTDLYNRYQYNFTKTPERLGFAVAEWLPTFSDPANFKDTVMDIGESTIEENKGKLVYVFNPLSGVSMQYIQTTLSDTFELDGEVNVYHRPSNGMTLAPDTLGGMYYRNPPYSDNADMSYLSDAEYVVEGKTITVAAYNMPRSGAIVVEIPVKVKDEYTSNFELVAGIATAKYGDRITKADNFDVVSEYNNFEATMTKTIGSPKLARMADVREEVIGGGEYPFEFTIRLYDASGNELTDTYTATLSDGTTMSVQSGVPVTFNSNKVLTIDGLPHGATYSIEESESPGWECINKDNANGDIVANSIAHASFTNVYSAMGEISLTAKKRVEGMDTPGGGVQEAMPQFEFIVVDENDNQVSIATNDENGNISLPLYFNMDDNGKEYTYYIKEKAGNISDIIYDDNSFPVVVRVNDNGAGEMVAEVEYQDDTRIFTNRRVTTLDVTKTVNGNMGDKSKSFTFTANLKGENITYMKINDNGVFERGDATEEFTFTLGHGERIHFENLTFGEEYSIVEEELVDYEQTSENASGVQEGQTASFVNTKSSTVPTRVTAPGNPYWIIPLIAGGIVIAVVIGKKRKRKVA